MSEELQFKLGSSAISGEHALGGHPMIVEIACMSIGALVAYTLYCFVKGWVRKRRNG